MAPTKHMEHGSFLGGWRQGQLVSVVFVGNSRSITTFGPAPDVGTILDQALRGPDLPRLFVGPSEHAGIVRRRLAKAGASPYLDRAQAYYVLTPETLVPQRDADIRPASVEEAEQVARAQAAMTEEDLLIPRGQIDLSRLREISKRRIIEGKVWVMTEGTHLLFKTEESARTQEGILVGGVYTDPAHRGRSLATRGMAAWAHHLFAEGLCAIALHVNADNRAAIKVYERVGFRRHSELRLMLTY